MNCQACPYKRIGFFGGTPFFLSMESKKRENIIVGHYQIYSLFESIVDYVIVRGYNEEGNADPSMITFVYRTGFNDCKDANHFKPERLNAAKKKTGSGSHNKEVCQSDDTSSNSSSCHSGLQSLAPYDSNILQSNTSPDAYRDCMFIVQISLSKTSYQRKSRYE